MWASSGESCIFNNRRGVTRRNSRKELISFAVWHENWTCHESYMKWGGIVVVVVWLSTIGRWFEHCHHYPVDVAVQINKYETTKYSIWPRWDNMWNNNSGTICGIVGARLHWGWVASRSIFSCWAARRESTKLRATPTWEQKGGWNCKIVSPLQAWNCS